MPFSAKVVNMRRFTPITPTMPKPVIVIRQVSLIEDMPLIGLDDFPASRFTIVPGASGLKVFLMSIGIFLWHTG